MRINTSCRVKIIFKFCRTRVKLGSCLKKSLLVVFCDELFTEYIRENSNPKYRSVWYLFNEQWVAIIMCHPVDMSLGYIFASRTRPRNLTWAGQRIQWKFQIPRLSVQCFRIIDFCRSKNTRSEFNRSRKLKNGSRSDRKPNFRLFF